MKLKLHSFDFEECTLTFSIPKDIMHSNRFGNVPEGVEVDLAAITQNSEHGIEKPESGRVIQTRLGEFWSGHKFNIIGPLIELEAETALEKKIDQHITEASTSTTTKGQID